MILNPIIVVIGFEYLEKQLFLFFKEMILFLTPDNYGWKLSDLRS